jgi:hypothetical protein
MGYGLQSFTGTGASITQIDSDYNMENMAPVASGAAYSVASDYNNDIVLVNTIPASTHFKIVLAWATTSNLYFRVVTDSFPTSNPRTQTVDGALSYVKFGKTQSTSASGSYGLQVFKAPPNNTVPAFDSRLYTTAGTPNITNVYQSNTFTGTAGLATSSSRISTSISGVYVNLFPSLLSSDATLNSNDIWVYPKGYLFANNHGTYGTGIYYFGGSIGFFGGYANQTNPTAIIQAS